MRKSIKSVVCGVLAGLMLMTGSLTVSASELGSITVTGSAVNVRSSASTSSSKVGTASKNQKYDVYGFSGVFGGKVWYKIALPNEKTGYMVSTYASFASGGKTVGTVKLTAVASVRKGAGTKYARIKKYSKGTTFDVVGISKVGSKVWFAVKLPGGKTGYVTSTYCKFTGKSAAVPKSIEPAPAVTTTVTAAKAATTTTAAPAVKAAPPAAKALGKVTITGGTVNVRKGAGTSYGKVTTVKKNATYEYTETKKVGKVTWYHIPSGWVSGDYAKVTGSTTTTKATTTTQAPAKATTAAPSSVKSGILLPSGNTKATYFKSIKSDPKKFIEAVSLLAVYEQEKNNILASVTIAQAFLESGRGTSSVAQSKNNMFGICKSGGGYKSYSSVQDCFAGHSKLLKGSYYNGSKKGYDGTKCKVVGNKDYKSICKGLCGTYAMDKQYASKLIDIIQKYDLTKYDSMKCADFGFNI